MAMRKHICPICGQGWVVPVEIKTTGQIVYVCTESEETWLSEADIAENTWSETPRRGHYSYLNQVMDSLGLEENSYNDLKWPELGG